MTAGLSDAIADAVTSVHPAAAIVMFNGSPRLALSVAELGKLLGVDRRQIYAWIQSGALPALALGAPGGENRHYRIAVSAVIDLLNTGPAAPGS